LEDGVKRLVLVIDLYRDLGPLDRPTEPRWLHYARTSATVRVFSWEWQDWMKYRHTKMAKWETTPASEKTPGS
jgi:hypothetical protein